MNVYIKAPYFSAKAYDLDRNEHVLITGEFKDGLIVNDSTLVLRCDTKEERDAMHHLVAGKEIDTLRVPANHVETQDNCPVIDNVIKSLGATRYYIILDEKIREEFAKPEADGHSDMEIMRLSKIQASLIKDYPSVKWIDSLTNKCMEKHLAGKHGSDTCTHKSSGSLEGVKTSGGDLDG